MLQHKMSLLWGVVGYSVCICFAPCTEIIELRKFSKVSLSDPLLFMSICALHDGETHLFSRRTCSYLSTEYKAAFSQLLSKPTHLLILWSSNVLLKN